MIFDKLPNHSLFKGKKPLKVRHFKPFYSEMGSGKVENKVYEVWELTYSSFVIQIWKDGNNYSLQLI